MTDISRGDHSDISDHCLNEINNVKIIDLNGKFQIIFFDNLS